MYEVQWPIIKKSLDKIDQIAEKVNNLELSNQQIKDAINGNGSIGIKDQLIDFRCKLEKKADKEDIEVLKKKLENKRKTSREWVKSLIPWIIAIASIAVTWLKA